MLRRPERRSGPPFDQVVGRARRRARSLSRSFGARSGRAEQRRRPGLESIGLRRPAGNCAPALTGLLLSALLVLGLPLLLAARDLPASGEAAPRIAIVTSREIGPYLEAVDGFRTQILSSLPGAVLTTHNLDGDLSRGPGIAATLDSSSCDLVHVVGTEAYKAMAGIRGKIPMVISMVYDPESEFQLDPVHDSNVYGAALRVPIDTQIEIVHRFCPEIGRISVIYGPESSIIRSEIEEAKPTKIDLDGIPIDHLDELERALDRVRSGSDAFLMVLDPNIYTKTTTQNILLYFMRAKIPVFSFSPNFAKAGALLSVSSRYGDNGATAARLATDVLTGVAVSTRIVPTPGLRVDWNERAARALGKKLSRENRALCTDVYGS